MNDEGQNAIHKTLIIRFSSVGDVLLSSLLCRVLRNRFPESTIDFVVKSEYADLVRHNPHLNHVVEFPPGAGQGELLRLRRTILAGRQGGDEERAWRCARDAACLLALCDQGGAGPRDDRPGPNLESRFVRSVEVFVTRLDAGKHGRLSCADLRPGERYVGCLQELKFDEEGEECRCDAKENHR